LVRASCGASGYDRTPSRAHIHGERWVPLTACGFVSYRPPGDPCRTACGRRAPPAVFLTYHSPRGLVGGVVGVLPVRHRESCCKWMKGGRGPCRACREPGAGEEARAP
jgi:hypothetical protein